MALAGVKEKYYKAGDLDDFQEALQEGSKEKEYTTPEDMVEDYSEKDTDKGTNSHKSDDSGFMSEKDEFDFEYIGVDWVAEDDVWEDDDLEDYSEKDTDKGTNSHKSDDSGFMSEEEEFEEDDWVYDEDINFDFVDEKTTDKGTNSHKSEESNIFSEEDDLFGDWDGINSGFELEEEYGWRNRFKDLNTSNKENTDRICTTLKECFTELAIVGIIMTMFALLINIVMKDDK